MTSVNETAIARVERSGRPPANLGQFLDLVKPRIASVLPGHVNAETLIRVVQTFGNQNEKLLKCTESSLLTSLMLCSQLGLPPNTPQGFAWLIPFWNGRQKVMECKVMFGKNGLAELVRNSGQILRMNSGVVYEHEVKSGAFVHSNEPPSITHRSDVLAPAELYSDEHLVAAYAVLETKEGGRVQRVLRKDEILRRRDASQAVQRAKQKGYRTPWDDWPGPMWTKTAIRALCGMPEVPKSTDLVTALTNDIDSPQFDELQKVTVTRADGFRDQAAAVIDVPGAASAPALPAGDAQAAPTPAQAPEAGKPATAGATADRKATKAQTGRLWSRWAKITDCDPKAPAPVDKESFHGFVAHRIGAERAGDSSKWTTADCKLIGKGLDELRDGKPAGPPATEAAPAPDSPAELEEGPPAADEEPPAPEISKADAIDQLKKLRVDLEMDWETVREIARGLGATAASSAKWTVEQLLGVADAMRARAAEGEPPTAADGEQPETPSDTEE